MLNKNAGQHHEYRPRSLPHRPRSLPHRPRSLAEFTENRPRSLPHRPRSLPYRPRSLAQLTENRPRSLPHRPRSLAEITETGRDHCRTLAEITETVRDHLVRDRESPRSLALIIGTPFGGATVCHYLKRETEQTTPEHVFFCNMYFR